MANGLIDLLKQKFHNIESLFNGNGDTKLLNSKRTAFNYFLENGIPTRKDEEWKYTNINFLNKIDFSAQSVIDVHLNIDEILSENKINDIDTYKIVFLNGKLQASKCLLPTNGIKIEEFDSHSSYSTQMYNEKNPEIFRALNAALLDNGIQMIVEKSVTFDKPFRFIYLWSSDVPVIFHPAVYINIGENSSINLIEDSYQIGNGKVIINKVFYINIGENSSVGYDRLQNGPELYIFDSIDVNQHSSSKYKSNTVSLSGNFIRNEVKVDLAGRGAETEVNGFFLTRHDKLVDNHILIEHSVPDCLSKQLFKGVLADSSTGVFSGKVLVKKDAQRTNAYQSNKNILLSNDAQINTKPQLEIYADDVKCSHGATSGYIDKEAMFYLISRGIGEENALKLLLKAFANEVSMKFASDEFGEYVSEAVSDALDFNY